MSDGGTSSNQSEFEQVVQRVTSQLHAIKTFIQNQLGSSPADISDADLAQLKGLADEADAVLADTGPTPAPVTNQPTAGGGTGPVTSPTGTDTGAGTDTGTGGAGTDTGAGAQPGA